MASKIPGPGQQQTMFLLGKRKRKARKGKKELETLTTKALDSIKASQNGTKSKSLECKSTGMVTRAMKKKKGLEKCTEEAFESTSPSIGDSAAAKPRNKMSDSFWADPQKYDFVPPSHLLNCSEGNDANVLEESSMDVEANLSPTVEKVSSFVNSAREAAELGDKKRAKRLFDQAKLSFLENTLANTHKVEPKEITQFECLRIIALNQIECRMSTEKTFKQMWTVANNHAENSGDTSLFVQNAQIQIHVGILTMLMQFVDRASSDKWRINAECLDTIRTLIIEDLMRKQRFDDARELAHEIQDEEKRERILAKIKEASE